MTHKMLVTVLLFALAVLVICRANPSDLPAVLAAIRL